MLPSMDAATLGALLDDVPTSVGSGDACAVARLFRGVRGAAR